MHLITLLERYRPLAPIRNGLIIYAERDTPGSDALPPTVLVAGECLVTGDWYIVGDVPLEGLAAWSDGAKPIQHALPDLSPADREFIRSGVKPGVLTPLHRGEDWGREPTGP